MGSPVKGSQEFVHPTPPQAAEAPYDLFQPESRNAGELPEDLLLAIDRRFQPPARY
jgi:hypothetical protein